MRLVTVVPAAALLVALAAGSARAASPAEEGARLYRAKCSSCHRLRDPGERSAESWRAVLQRMAPKAHLSDPERAAVLAYLEAHAKGGPPKK